jgi:hypothetical protein
MFIQRKSERHPSRAAAKVLGCMVGNGLLKDIDILGCCIESTMQVDIQPGADYEIEVIPEKETGIGRFGLDVQARWVRHDEYACDMGFLLTASPKGREFQRYVDYLSLKPPAPAL